MYNFEIFKGLLIIHFIEHAAWIVNLSSNAAHLREHPCSPPLQPVALPQSLLLGVNHKHSHRPVPCSGKAPYVTWDVFFAAKNYSRSFVKLCLNHWCKMDYFNDACTTFLGLECFSCIALWMVRKLPDFIKNILICVVKMNEGLNKNVK